MYSIYVTNTTYRQVYIRLQHEKLSAVNPSFHDELDKLKGDNEKGKLSSYLVRWGFCLLPPGQTMPFPVDVVNYGPWRFASLYEESYTGKLWNMDYEMNCMRYGCLFLKEMLMYHQSMFHFEQANPKPFWVPAKKGAALPRKIEDIVCVGFQEGLDVYFGRSSCRGAPRSVNGTRDGRFSSWKPINDEQIHESDESGHVLYDRGHEFVRAKAGDPVPPHAVVTGVSEPEGSLYLGRVGGNIPCTISTEGGNIKYFCYQSNKVQSGEILVLTNDPTIR